MQPTESGRIQKRWHNMHHPVEAGVSWVWEQKWAILAASGILGVAYLFSKLPAECVTGMFESVCR